MTATTSQDLLRRFHDLASRFRRAAEAGDLAGMEHAMTHRRSLVEKLSGLPEPQTADDRARATELLEGILELDREAEGLLERQRSEIGQQLTDLTKGARGLHGYSATAGRSPARIDERG